jgi:hypothetical protein
MYSTMTNQLKKKIPILIILALGTAMLVWYSISDPPPPPPPPGNSFREDVNKMGNEPFNPALYQQLRATLEMQASQSPKDSSRWQDDMETLNLQYGKSLVYSFDQTITSCGTADGALLNELDRMKSICILCNLNPYADAFRIYKNVTDGYDQLNPILAGEYQPAADRLASQLRLANGNALLQKCSTIQQTYSSFYDRLSGFSTFHQRFMKLHQQLQSAATNWQNYELQKYGYTTGEYDGATEQACLNIHEITKDQLRYYYYYLEWYNQLRSKYIVP